MPKEKILKELEDVVEAVNAQNGIAVPVEVVEALLVAESMGNRAAVKAVCQQIREAAQDQNPDKFPG